MHDLFEQAHQAVPTIIINDEIDTSGQSRGGVVNMGSNDEREQTLNQLLSEIDGFHAEKAARRACDMLLA